MTNYFLSLKLIIIKEFSCSVIKGKSTYQILIHEVEDAFECLGWCKRLPSPEKVVFVEDQLNFPQKRETSSLERLFIHIQKTKNKDFGQT